MLGCFGLFLLTHGRAEAALLTGFNAQQQDDRQVFELQFDSPPQLKIHDEITAQHYYYVDFYGVDGPDKPAQWDYDAPWIFHVKRLYYPEARVLRMIFYARKGADPSLTIQSAGNGQYQLVARSFARLSGAGQAVGGSRKLVVIDPGHGGMPKDGQRFQVGARTSRPVNGRHYYEKELVLDIARHLKALIDQAPNLDSAMSRTGDYYVSLPERIDFANRVQGDLFLSIHLNGSSSRRKTARGFEIFYLSDGSKETHRQLEAMENMDIDIDENYSGQEAVREILRSLADDRFHERQSQSRELCQLIGEEFRRHGPFRQHYRGVKSAAFRVLMNFEMPAALVECGFLDHPDEAAELVEPGTQQRIAALLFNGINRYFAQEDPAFVPLRAAVP